MLRALIAVVAFLIMSPVALAGEYLGEWKITRYYTPLPDQERYYNGWLQNAGECSTANLYYAPYGGKYKGSYTAELCMQSDGEPFHTADGTDVRDVEPMTIAACPRFYLGKTLHIAQIGYVRCADTGGAINRKRIDVWAGIGNDGYERIQTAPGGLLSVYLKTP